MKVKIIKGTSQIGGCITEISSAEAKIIIDFGEDLIDSETKKQKIPIIVGLTTGKPKYDAVFITHSHGDHMGLICNVLEEIPIYVEEQTKKIYDILNDFTNKKELVRTEKMEFEETIIIKDIKITYYIVDHSAYNSSMILIESNGKKILHTGDFRSHGYKGKLLDKTLTKIGKVDCLITEGTSFGRSEKPYETEKKLSELAEDIFKEYNQIFILQSSTNIDRIVSFYKASKKTGKIFVEDIFTANITSTIEDSIPNPITFKDVFVWNPLKYRNKPKTFKEKYINQFLKYSNSKVLSGDYTMMVKTSMLDDIKLLHEKKIIRKACLVYSMWNGYLEAPAVKEFVNKVRDLGIDFKILHTSGHADIMTIKKVINKTKPNIVIPIHINNREDISKIIKNVVQLKDNEEKEIVKI